MKITKEFLQKKQPCSSSYRWVCNNGLIGLEDVEFINKLLENYRFSDANWLITRILDNNKNVQYAIYCAEQVIDIFEKEYPEDNRPRKAIEATKNYLITHVVPDITIASDADSIPYNAIYAAARAAAYATYAAINIDTNINADYTFYSCDNAMTAIGDDSIVKQKIINFGIKLILEHLNSNEEIK